MLQAASTVGSKDGGKKGKKKRIYIKEEKIFTAYLIKKKKKEGKIKRGERSTSRKEFTRLFFLLPPASLLWL